MGIRTRIANWILKDYQSGARLIDTRGKSASGVNVTEDSAMRLAAVNACVRVLSEDVASLPEHVYRRTKDGGKARAREHYLYRILHDSPNPEMTAFTFKQTLMVNVLLSGNAYAFIEFDRGGRVRALWPLPSDMVRQFRDENTGEMRYDIRGWRSAAASEMLHVPGLGYDGVKGLSPIAYARESIGLSIAAEEFGGRFFSNGTHLGGVIETDAALSDEAFERMKDGFSAMYKGLRNSHGIPILEEGAHFKPLGVNQKDAQFLDTRKYQRSEIAAIFRVPPHMIGDLERATFSNIEHQSIEYLQRSLVPWLVRIEQEQKRKLLTEQEQREFLIEHDTSNFLRGDTLSRMQAYGYAVQSGIMTQNECRARENLNPKPGGDELLRPQNLAVAGQAKEGRSGAGAWGAEFGAAPETLGFNGGRERRSASATEIAAMAGVSEESVRALIAATREWLRRQAEDIRGMLREAEEGAERGFLPREQRKGRKYSVQHLMNNLNSYYQYGAKNGAEALEKAVAAGEFPDWKDMTEAIEGMAEMAWEGVREDIGAEANGIDEAWMQGFVKRYQADMGARLAQANLNELTRAMESAGGQKAINMLDSILGKWQQGDRAEDMAKNEVMFCVNEAKIAAYRKAGYACQWASGANCCPICTKLNGRTIKTIKPPLHKGCICTVRRKGAALTAAKPLTPMPASVIIDTDEQGRPTSKTVNGYKVDILYGHASAPLKYKNKGILDIVSEKGISRYIYDEDGVLKAHIDNGDHGNPGTHPFKNGEHMHWAVRQNGKFVQFGDAEELTDHQRQMNADILKNDQ